MENQDLPEGKSVALWNPGAAINWSVFLSPAFGSYLHAKNWHALGEANKARKQNAWFIINCIATLVAIIGIYFVIGDEDLARRMGAGIYLAALMTWYFTSARDQVKYVKREFSGNYTRRPWLGAIAVAALLFFGSAAISSFLHPLNESSLSAQSVHGQTSRASMTTILPTCESIEAKDALIRAFDGAQFAREENLSAVLITNIHAHPSSTDVKRQCTATIRMNNAEDAQIEFSIDMVDDENFMLEFELLEDARVVAYEDDHQQSTTDNIVEIITAQAHDADEEMQELEFKSFPAGQIFDGPNAPVKIDPDLVREAASENAHPAIARHYEALIGTMSSKVDFAGEYVVAQWSPGVGIWLCEIINARTGEPLAQDICQTLANTNYDPFEYRRDSRLFIVSGSDEPGTPGSRKYYVFDGTKFSLLKTDSSIENIDGT